MHLSTTQEDSMGEAKRRQAADNTALRQDGGDGGQSAVGLRIPSVMGVGIPFPGYPVGREAMVLDWTGNVCTAVIGCEMQPGDIDILRRGRLKAGLLERDGVIFLVLSWPDLMTVDLPYSAGLLKEHNRPQLHELVANERCRLSIAAAFIDASTGIGCGVRLFTVSPEFTRRLVGHISRQASTTRREHDARVEAVYRTFPTTTDMLAAAEIVEVVGL
jgi:hypothetical protein